MKTNGASIPWPVPGVVLTSKGQQNISSPSTTAAPSSSPVRQRTRMAGCRKSVIAPARSWLQRLRDLVHGQPFLRGQDLRDLWREGR